MKFFVPALGTKFKLTKPWQFILFNEYRNRSILTSFGSLANEMNSVQIKRRIWSASTEEKAFEFVLPANTVMGVDRIYIRKGGEDFSSITLKIFETSHPFVLFSCKKKNGEFSPAKARFWVKLCDFNKIEADIVKNSVLPHNFVK